MKTRFAKTLLFLCLCLCAMLASCGEKTGTSDIAGNGANNPAIHTEKSDVSEVEHQEKRAEWKVTELCSFDAEGIDIVYGVNSDNAIVFEKNGKFGLMDNNGNVRMQPKYDSLEAFSEKYCYAELDGKYGVVSADDEIVVPFTDDVRERTFDKDLLLLRKTRTAELYNLETGELMTTFTGEYDYVPPEVIENKDWFVLWDGIVYHMSYVYKQNKGYKELDYNHLEIYDKNGDLIQEFDNFSQLGIDRSYHEYVWWQSGREKYAMIDGKMYSETVFSSSTVIGKPEYLNAKNKMSICKIDGKTGVNTLSGETVVPAQFDDCRILDNGFVVVKKDKKYGLYNNKGEKLSECLYDDFGTRFYDGYIGMEADGFWGLMDENGNVVCETTLDRRYGTGDYKYVPPYSIDQNQIYNFEAGETISYDELDFYSGAPAGMFTYKKENGACGIATYKQELVEFDTEAEFIYTRDKKVAIIKQEDKYTFFKLEK